MILAHEHGGRAHKSELIVLKCFPIGTLLADTLALLAGCSLVGSSLVHRIRHRVSVCSCFLLRFVCVCLCIGMAVSPSMFTVQLFDDL